LLADADVLVVREVQRPIGQKCEQKLKLLLDREQQLFNVGFWHNADVEGLAEVSPLCGEGVLQAIHQQLCRYQAQPRASSALTSPALA
jgi:hypothetical protein